MNRYTFGDVRGGRRAALSNELAADGDSDVEEERAGRSAKFDGEESMGKDVDRFDEAGVEIEAFNLQAEREEGGHFDANGNYVFRKGNNEQDAWITAIDEADMEKNIGEAAEAKKKRDALVKNKIDSAEKKNEVTSQESLKKKIIKYGAPKDTVSKAIQRLSSAVKGETGSKFKPVLAGKRERKNGSGGGDQKAVATPHKSKEEAVADKRQMIELIELADQLLSNGMVSVYNMTFEAILNSLFEWEYQGADGNINGPYSCNDIAKWKQGGYFIGAQAVMMRPRKRPSTVSGRKRQVGFLGGGEPAAKKARKADTEDLLGDLEESDSDNEESGEAVKEEDKGRNEEREEDLIDFSWRPSDTIDFGPADAVMAPSSSSSSAAAAVAAEDDDYGDSGARHRRSALSLKDDDGESD